MHTLPVSFDEVVGLFVLIRKLQTTNLSLAETPIKHDKNNKTCKALSLTVYIVNLTPSSY